MSEATNRCTVATVNEMFALIKVQDEELKKTDKENLILRRALQQAVKQLLKLPNRTLYDVIQLEEWEKMSK